MSSSYPHRTARSPRDPAVPFQMISEGFTLNWMGQSVTFTWAFGTTTEPRRRPRPDHASLWGPGTSLVVGAHWSPGFSGEVRLNGYYGHPEVVLSGEIYSPEKPITIRRVPLFHWKASSADVREWRLLINSGDQGYSGSLGLDQRVEELSFSQDVTVLRGPGLVLALGNLTFSRTNVLFQRRRDMDGGILVEVFLDYGAMLLPAGQRLRLEALLILPHMNPLLALEAYADRVVEVLRPRFNRSLVGLYNQWYAHWTPTSDHGSASLALQGAEALKRSGLDRYGIAILGSGVWHDQAAFGEQHPWPGLFPEGILALRDHLVEMGMEFMHGGFWSKASACATVFRERPEWMAKDETGNPAEVESQSWGACPYPYYVPDITFPAVQDWMREQWAHICQSSTGFYWLDFFGTGTKIGLENERPRPLYFSDPTLSFPFETDRLNVQIIREVVGEDAIIAVYTSPTFNLIGLVDRARVALDCGAIDPPRSARRGGDDAETLMTSAGVERRWHHVQAVARNLAASYFCHDRFWINDPDPAMVGLVERPETLEEARVRLILAANSGGFITVGEIPEQIPASRLDLLKRILPPLGVASRPLDLFERDVAQIFDLPVRTSWDEWRVLTLINWEEREQCFDMALDMLGLGGPQNVFEFWDQAYFGRVSRELLLRVPPRCCRVYCIRPWRPHPWLLSTDLHVTQGGVEVAQVNWDAERSVLGGSAYRPNGEGHLVFFLPEGYGLRQAEVNGELVTPEIEQKFIVRLPVRFGSCQVTWEVSCDTRRQF